MTNGEKLIETFPSIGLYKKAHDGIQINFNSVWFNAEYKEPTTKNNLGVDCISRADVLQTLLDYDYANENALVIKDIKALHSVTPQPRKGKWITYLSTAIEDFYQCSECGRMVHVKQTDSIKNYPYCHCGAKMIGTEEEE